MACKVAREQHRDWNASVWIRIMTLPKASQLICYSVSPAVLWCYWKLCKEQIDNKCYKKSMASAAIQR